MRIGFFTELCKVYSEAVDAQCKIYNNLIKIDQALIEYRDKDLKQLSEYDQKKHEYLVRKKAEETEKATKLKDTIHQNNPDRILAEERARQPEQVFSDLAVRPVAGG